MFDIGTRHFSPEAESLCLNMIDSSTQSIIQKKFLSKNKQREYNHIPQIRKELINSHTNMEVNKATIEFDHSDPLVVGQTREDESITNFYIDG